MKSEVRLFQKNDLGRQCDCWIPTLRQTPRKFVASRYFNGPSNRNQVYKHASTFSKYLRKYVILLLWKNLKCDLFTVFLL